MAILVNIFFCFSVSRRRQCMRAACMAGLMSMALTAAAQSGADPSAAPRNPLGFVVGADVSHDSNLFRQPSSAARTSDTISIGYVGLRLDKQVSLQRFQLDVTETIRRYASTSRLDFESLDYRAAWLWQVNSILSGTLSADRREALVPFEDVLTPGITTRNVRVSETQAFSLDAWVLVDWHLLMGISQTTQTSDQAIEIQPDFKAVSHEAGVRYAPKSGSSITAVRRSTSGDFINQSNNPVLGRGYQQDENEIRVHWLATGKSTLSGRLTWLDRTHEGAGQRNFSGLAGEIGYALAATGKLGLNFVARRDLVPFQDTTGSYVVNNTLSIAPTWRITARTVARLLAARTTSKFSGVATAPLAGPPRNDTLHLVEVGVDWSPMDRLTFGASVLRQARDSTVPAFEFENTIARITANYRY